MNYYELREYYSNSIERVLSKEDADNGYSKSYWGNATFTYIMYNSCFDTLRWQM